MRQTGSLATADERACMRALVTKQALPLAMLVLFATLLINKSSDLDFGTILASVKQIAVWQWALAGLCTMASFIAVGRMEYVIHRISGLATPSTHAQLTGMTAVATAQLTGFGLLTGTLARWRALPDLSLWQAARITGAVCLAFMTTLAVIAAALALIIGPDLPFARPIAALVLLCTLALIAISLWRPRILMSLPVPSIRAQLTLLGLTAIDTTAAALAFYILLPPAIAPDPALFYMVFLLSLGAGLLGTTPGGLGPFELMFLTCLPLMPQDPTLAAILAFRLIYFGAPACLAALVLIVAPFRAGVTDAPRVGLRKPGLARPNTALSFTAHRAEAGLMRQGEFDLLCDAGGRPLSLVAPAGQSLIMLADPLLKGASRVDTLSALETVAQTKLLTPAIYKCSARTALIAKQAGWKICRVAREAWVNPARFDTSAPAFRQLRRHIRKAEKAGVTIETDPSRLPLVQMQQLAQSWAAHRGGARGFSMGRFDADYVTGQRVHLAYLDQRLIGFASFHEAWHERALDLMCQTLDAPPGTMHLLIADAIQSAAMDGCDRLSLAAVPEIHDHVPLPNRLRDRMRVASGSAGLARFKTCFAPRWEPLYLAAPSHVGLSLASLDLVDRITRPRRTSPR